MGASAGRRLDNRSRVANNMTWMTEKDIAERSGAELPSKYECVVVKASAMVERLFEGEFRHADDRRALLCVQHAPRHPQGDSAAHENE